jgi:hypothetical protein
MQTTTKGTSNYAAKEIVAFSGQIILFVRPPASKFINRKVKQRLIKLYMGEQSVSQGIVFFPFI